MKTHIIENSEKWLTRDERKARIYIFDNSCRSSSNSCWIWRNGCSGSSGYGQGYFNGRQILAHRLSFWAFKGPFPRKMCVCHTCDNPPCVNPKHLFLGTNKDNTRDRIKKGRTTNPKGKKQLSPAQRKEIRELFVNNHTSQKELAEQFGVCAITIRKCIYDPILPLKIKLQC